jgi:hypothetical protein
VGEGRGLPPFPNSPLFPLLVFTSFLRDMTGIVTRPRGLASFTLVVEARLQINQGYVALTKSML